MAYIIGIFTAILALAVWQENTGSAHDEMGLGAGDADCPECGQN
ncbi:hypothetical protein [Pseudohalioglobus sediminis]|nr:hypothetical protein [Pseudohalioglobus sediminis]